MCALVLPLYCTCRGTDLYFVTDQALRMVNAAFTTVTTITSATPATFTVSGWLGAGPAATYRYAVLRLSP